MRMGVELLVGGTPEASPVKRARSRKPLAKADVASAKTAPAATTKVKTRSKAAKPRPEKRAEAAPVGSLPILYMLSPQKFMSPFDCNMALDSGYKVVLPYDNVTVEDVTALVQDAMFSRPPKSATAVFLGGKDISLALEMMKAAKAAIVPPFEVSIFADPGGSFTTAGALVASVESVLARHAKRGWRGLTVSIFGATGVVGFASSVLAAEQGAKVRIVGHQTLDDVTGLAAIAKERFGVDLEPVLGDTTARKTDLLATSDVAFTTGPAGVNILTRRQIARASRLIAVADVNAVPPYGVEGMDLFMNGVPLPGSSTLGVGALAIGDVKYKTQAGLFQRMLTGGQALNIDFRDAYALAREIAGVPPIAEKRSAGKRRG